MLLPSGLIHCKKFSENPNSVLIFYKFFCCYILYAIKKLEIIFSYLKRLLFNKPAESGTFVRFAKQTPLKMTRKCKLRFVIQAGINCLTTLRNISQQQPEKHATKLRRKKKSNKEEKNRFNKTTSDFVK